MTIKKILDEIASEGGSNKKMEILAKYKDNELLRQVIYLAKSKRIKFYLKQIPEYNQGSKNRGLEWAIDQLENIYGGRYRGNDAIEHLTTILEAILPEDAYIIERIIDRDLKIGMGTSNINKIFPKLIEKTPYMGAISFNAQKAKDLFKDGNCLSQVKMDGRYCNAIIRNHEVEMESRGGEPTVLNGCNFEKELEHLNDIVLNGELTMDGVSRYESNGIIASLIDITKKQDERGSENTQKKIEAFKKKHGLNYKDALNKIRFTVWDAISVDEYYDNKSNNPYTVRFARLIRLVNNLKMVSLIESKFVRTYEEAIEHFQEMLNRGDEGTILKSDKGTWKDGKPKWQIKMKLEMDIDLKIVGFNYGTGKNSELISSLNCETSDGKLKTRPTGITEDDMNYITKNQKKLLGTLVEVKCSGLSQDSSGNYSLLHPVFKMLRDDKRIANSLNEVKSIENMIKGLK